MFGGFGKVFKGIHKGITKVGGGAHNAVKKVGGGAVGGVRKVAGGVHNTAKRPVQKAGRMMGRSFGRR